MENNKFTLYFFEDNEECDISTAWHKVKKAICKGEPIEGFSYGAGLIDASWEEVQGVLGQVGFIFKRPTNVAILDQENEVVEVHLNAF